MVWDCLGCMVESAEKIATHKAQEKQRRQNEKLERTIHDRENEIAAETKRRSRAENELESAKCAVIDLEVCLQEVRASNANDRNILFNYFDNIDQGFELEIGDCLRYAQSEAETWSSRVLQTCRGLLAVRSYKKVQMEANR